MTKQEFNNKRDFWLGIIKTVLALILFGVVAGAANSYIKLEQINKKGESHTKKFNKVENELSHKVDRREMDNLKDFLRDNFKTLNKRLDNIQNK